MRRGYFYRHECAPDIYIDVHKTQLVEVGVWEVECDVYGYWLECLYESTVFRLAEKDGHMWKVFNPVTR